MVRVPKSIYVALGLLAFASAATAADSEPNSDGWLPGQDRHPGNPGEYAPGGEIVSIPLPDIAMSAVLYRPTDLAKGTKSPAVVILHGWTPYNVRSAESYSYAASEYARNGFVALAVAMRGWPETGGDDDCGLTQPGDIVEAVNWLSRQPAVDPDKIAIMGQSFGGQVALSAAALTPKIKAVAAYFPVTHFAAWGASKPQQMRDDYILGMCARTGSPADRSPVYQAEEITAAVLFLHGEKDSNVPIEHTQDMYDRMRLAGGDATLVVMKGGEHGAGGPGWERHHEMVFDFLRNKM